LDAVSNSALPKKNQKKFALRGRIVAGGDQDAWNERGRLTPERVGADDATALAVLIRLADDCELVGCHPLDGLLRPVWPGDFEVRFGLRAQAEVKAAAIHGQIRRLRQNGFRLPAADDVIDRPLVAVCFSAIDALLPGTTMAM